MWYKNAVIYNLDVETFMDSDGNGVGDFQGLIDRIDHLENLGVNCVWLQPFFPSPNRDDGYDVTDYYSVDPRLGTLGDFAEFAHALQERGIRLIVDLVVNHTSDQHPWFQAACRDLARPGATSTSGRPRSPPTPTRAWSSRACRRRPGPGTSRSRPTTSTASSRTSPI